LPTAVEHVNFVEPVLWVLADRTESHVP
jgi:hypothetical protein